MKIIDAEIIKGLVSRFPNALTQRESVTLSLRTGLIDGKRHTFRSIADTLKISETRARQIQFRGMRKLKDSVFRSDMPNREKISSLLFWGKYGEDAHQIAPRLGIGTDDVQILLNQLRGLHPDGKTQESRVRSNPGRA